MKVAVLGSGNGACAIAFEWAQAGHEVSMFDFEVFPDTISAIAAKGGISSDGELEGFQPIVHAGHDISKVVPGADLVFAVGPAYSTLRFGQVCAPHTHPGQVFVVCPSSCAGAVVLKQGLGVAIGDDSLIVAETSTLPYAVRVTGEAHITVYNRLKGGYYVAALPSSFTQQVYEMLHAVHGGIEAAANVWQTTLQNANPVIHPAVTLCNAALIERTGGDFLFYEEGVTPAVGRLIEAVDDDRLAIAEALGVDVIRDPELGIAQGYQAENNYSTGYSEAPGFRGIRAQPQLDYRYLNEDAGYGLVFLIDLARRLGVATPTMEAVLQVSSVMMARDYSGEQARTLAVLGLGDYTAEELKTLF